MGDFTLENGRLAVKVNDLGAELAGIYDKKNQREVLWQAEPDFWPRHAPVLFPNVGKFYRGGFWYDGGFYKEGQHGFARDMIFERAASGEDYVMHRLVSNEETGKRYPFDFVLEITHRLKGQTLEIQWMVENTGDHTMFFTIGGHPGFNVPVISGTKYSDYYLTFAENKDALEYILIDTATGTAMPDKVYRMELANHKYQIRDDMFDRDALIFDHGQIEEAGIAMPDGTPYISVSCKGFPNFGIWSVPGAPYVCLEPWCGRCDNRGFEGDISEKEGINRLECGEKFEKSYTITIY